MDSVLSEFIAHTGADPGLAQDILKGQQWDLSKSLQAFYFLKGITAVSVPSSNILTMVSPSLTEDNQHSAAVVKEDAFPPGRPLLNNDRHKQHHQYSQPLSPSITGNFPSSNFHQKVNAVDVDDTSKKLIRGISRATDNVNLVSKARSEFALDFQECATNDTLLDFIIETPVYTFTLPDLTIYPKDFAAFLEKDLIETSTLVSLEQAGRLNWWTEAGACQRLWPLATTGDGNCLLHAASLGMWGFHDRLLTLRKALHATLTKGPYRKAIWRRWRLQQTFQNREAGLVYSEEEWLKEWTGLLRLSSTEPRSGPSRRPISCCDGLIVRSVLEPVKDFQTNSNSSGHNIYESLEEIHVLALAHVLSRPIIVVADTVLKDVTGEPFAPIPFGGVYLPFECQPLQCHRSPLVLTYDAAHFSALVAMDREAYLDKTPQPAVIPLTDSDHNLLPLQYAVDPGEDFAWAIDNVNTMVFSSLTQGIDDKLALLLRYLDLEHVPVSTEKPVSVSLDVDAVLKKSNGSKFESTDSSSPSETETSSTKSSSGILESSLPKNRASNQLKAVARQFGSIGRSMSKRIKKNFGNIKLGQSNSYKEGLLNSGKNNNADELPATPIQQRHTLPPARMGATEASASNISKGQKYILAAKLNVEQRHEYQEEMLKNYLQSARLRFEMISNRQISDKDPSATKMLDIPLGCSLIDKTEDDSLRAHCHGNNHNLDCDVDNSTCSTLYGIGKSRFYAESSEGCVASFDCADGTAHVPNLNTLPPKTVSINPDQTLYLSNSTFYNDMNTPPATIYNSDHELSKKEDSKSEVLHFKRACQTPMCSFYGTEDFDFYCSQCHKQNKVSRSVNTYPRFSHHVRTTQI